MRDEIHSREGVPPPSDQLTEEERRHRGRKQFIRAALPGLANGRRSYDKIGWVAKLGFPAVVTWYLLTHIQPALERNTQAIERNTRAIRALVCRVDSQSCKDLP